MWPLCAADALDGDNMLAVDGDQGGQAGIDRGMIDLLRGGIELRDNLRLISKVGSVGHCRY